MLTNQFLHLNELSHQQKLRMFKLYAANYNNTSKPLFLSDISKKQYVILLLDEQNEIQGFSSIAVNPKNCGTNNYNIFFSGDTIISPKFWGTQELVKGFTEAVGRLLASDQQKKWYWFLMSKGHRTYMYLVLFFKTYYPHLKEANPELKQILNEVADKLFGKYWQPEKDLIVFPESMGELTPELAHASFEKRRNKHVAFFLEKNPDFYKGEELACITPLNFENIHPRLHQYMQKGFNEGIPVLDKIKIAV